MISCDVHLVSEQFGSCEWTSLVTLAHQHVDNSATIVARRTQCQSTMGRRWASCLHTCLPLRKLRTTTYKHRTTTSLASSAESQVQARLRRQSSFFSTCAQSHPRRPTGWSSRSSSATPSLRRLAMQRPFATIIHLGSASSCRSEACTL